MNHILSLTTFSYTLEYNNLKAMSLPNFLIVRQALYYAQILPF